MGSRAQLKLVSSEFDCPIYFYSHNGSGELHEVLAQGLKNAKRRWDDAEYFARILFSTMVKDEIDGETGYGIGTDEHDDLDYPAVEVNLDEKEVRFGGRSFDFEQFASDPVSFS